MILVPLGGPWRVDPEKTVLSGAPGSVASQFGARDLHLVMGAAAVGARRFTIEFLDAGLQAYSLPFG